MLMLKGVQSSAEYCMMASLSLQSMAVKSKCFTLVESV